LLAALVRAPGETRLRVLGAYRSTELGREGPLAMLLADLAREGIAGQTEVARLRAEAVADLLRQLLPACAEAGEDAQAADGARKMPTPAAQTETLPVTQMGPDAAPLSPEAERVLRQAAGVPFFVVSYVQALGLSADDSTSTAGRAPGAVLAGQSGGP